MLTPLLLINIFIASFLLLLGWIATLKDQRSLLNKVFTLFTLATAAWIICNYFSNVQDLNINTSLVFNHLVIASSTLSLGLLTTFVVLLVERNIARKIKGTYIALMLVIAAIACTPLMIRGIARQGDIYAIEFGLASIAYFLFLAASFLAIVVLLIKGIKHSRGISRKRIKNVAISLVATVLLILTTNAVVPLITGSFLLTNVGPLFTSVLVVGIFYSIVRHQLFDVRSVIARSLAYALAIGTLIILFASVLVILTSVFFPESQVENSTRIAYILIALALAFIAQPLKRGFDRITNRLFYRDAYDPQDFIAQINKSVVAEIELNSLIQKVEDAIERHLKVTHSVFIGVNDTGEVQYLGRSQQKIKLAKTDIEKINALSLIAPVVATDFLEEYKESELKRHLTANDIGATITILPGYESELRKFNGIYLFLGLKKSGNSYTSQDVRVLAVIANEMRLAVQNALRFEEISQFNITLQKKIDDATRDLQRSNTKLKALDEAKDDFISMASHQLRTPLTSVKGYLSMVLDGDAGAVKKEQRALLQQAFDSSQRMVFLISDLLNVSRIRTGKFIIENGVVNLASLVKAEVEQLQKTAASRHLTMTYEHPKDFPDVMLDETKIRQVVMNFLDNAIYYTPAGGSITVAVKATPRTIEYTVTDTGLGVPVSEQKHLFTKFFRAANAKKMRPDGTGLGLYMAKKVIVAQGGAIIFKSQPGKGSTFGFSFALHKVADRR